MDVISGFKGRTDTNSIISTDIIELIKVRYEENLRSLKI